MQRSLNGLEYPGGLHRGLGESVSLNGEGPCTRLTVLNLAPSIDLALDFDMCCQCGLVGRQAALCQS